MFLGGVLHSGQTRKQNKGAIDCKQAIYFIQFSHTKKSPNTRGYGNQNQSEGGVGGARKELTLRNGDATKDTSESFTRTGTGHFFSLHSPVKTPITLSTSPSCTLSSARLRASSVKPMEARLRRARATVGGSVGVAAGMVAFCVGLEAGGLGRKAEWENMGVGSGRAGLEVVALIGTMGMVVGLRVGLTAAELPV
ncbi:uncharacterized protein EV422DRAFT_517934 [Fimicolochytrium jonesii]|uniref:uncharacterized protein n=1 Tax=Fimicolochytrium jonesii TaxID=1396493 RepID=UPI0022FE81EA|nr:uncharacterized protein EV422DRAFT_517934 [Fimicolochytrium jonesii]KAI8825216.1 hypothetical protein EV422DRAFT_517934 [Fimicolochytrium jonesii]